METKTAFDYFKEFTEKHNKLTNLELISLFNKQVENAGWGIARQGYLWSLKEQLNERKIDYCSVGNENTMSYKHCVILKNKKLYKITELDKKEVEKIFNDFLKNNYPEKPTSNLKIIKYNNENILYKIDEQEPLKIKSNKVIKKYRNE